MKIVRKLNLIQAVTVTALVVMVMVAMVLLKSISANVDELTEEDMALEREIGLISDAYLRQMTSVERTLRYAMEGTEATHAAMARERKIFDEKAAELATEVSKTQALIKELASMEGDADPGHAPEMAEISQLVQTIADDAIKFEALANQIFGRIDQGRLDEARTMATEVDAVTGHLQSQLHHLDAI